MERPNSAMAHGSSPDTDLQAPAPRRRWLRALALVGSGLALGGLGLGWWGYQIARREIPPFLQSKLSDALGRPLKVGEFERFSPTGVRLGPSILPPTEDDFSWMKAKALEVNFNPLELLFTRTLRPSVVFEEPEVALKQGFDGKWRLQPPQSVGTQGFFKTELRSLQIRNANLVIGPISRSSIVEVPEGVTSATLVLLQNVNLRIRFSGTDNQTAALVVGGRLNNGAFQLRGEGQIDTRQLNLAVQAQQLPIESINPLLGGSVFVRNGMVSSNLDLRFRPEAADRLTVKGTARLRNGDIVITDLPSPLQAINGTMVFNGVGGSLEHSSLKFGPILVKAEGSVDARDGHDLAITIPDVSLAQVAEAFAQTLPVDAAGRFRVNTRITGPLREPQVAGDLANLGLVQIDRLGLGALTARFGANLDGATLHQAILRPVTGGTVTAQGQAVLNPGQRPPDLTLTAQTDLPLDGLADLYDLPLPGPWRLGPLRADARIAGTPADLRGQATWQLPQSTFPGRGQVSYAQGLVQATETLFQVGKGTLRASATADLGRRAWQATATGTDLGLALVSPQLRGTLTTDLQASGALTALTPADIRAQGQARFSHAVPLALASLNLASLDRLNLGGIDQLLPGPLSTRFAWTGQRLAIAEAVTPNLAAQGSVEVQFPPGRPPQIGPFDLAARLSEIDLAITYGLVNGPAWLRPRGRLAFDGTLRGTLADPRLAGTAGLRQVEINDFTLVEAVSGPVQASRSTGASVNLTGSTVTGPGEQIAAVLDPDLRPRSFRLARGEFLATGQRRGNRLDANLLNADLAALGLRPVPRPDLGILAGLLSATATVDLAELTNPAIAAQFTLDRPGLGTIRGDRLSGQVQYRDGLALLTGGQLQVTPTTQFMVTGSGRLFPQWQGQAEITTAGADFQDLLGALSLYSYADVGRLLNPAPLGQAVDLAVAPVGEPQAPLLDQAALARAMREAQQEGDRQRDSVLLPDLNQLEGRVVGTLGVQASQAEGLAADFEFTGQNWAWGRYDFDNQFLARGQLRDQVLSLDPVEFRAGDTHLSLLGDVSRQDSALQVRAEQLPLTAAATLLEVPFAVTGLLNLNANLTGAYTNPHLRGEFAVAGASINQQPIQEISSTFQYEEAYFSLDGRVVGSSPEPLTFSGTVPYALPFMAVQPPSDQIDLRATLKDDALSLVNLFTPLLVWGGGSATIDVRLGGTLQQPLVSGVAAFNQATFNSPILEASLASLTGNVQFQGTKIQIPSLQGTLFDGAFEVSGDLPLAPKYITPADQGLRLALTNLDFNFANEVRSHVDGYLTVTNALLAPTIGGDIVLQKTQIAVGPQLTQLANRLVVNPGGGVILDAIKTSLTQLTDVFPVQVDDLRLTLEPATVKALPVFSFDMAGALAISGSVPGLYADGSLHLQDGWINTVTAEFFLEPGRDNVVLFKPEYKLDPYLDVVLGASIPLQRSYSINPVNTTMGSAEIPVINPLGSNTVFDELRIEAQVKGPISQLFDNLELTSNPPYSEAQLLGMVSGGYLSDLGGVEPALALGSNLLGALTANAQDSIGDALGLRRFRLSASTIAPSDTGDTLGYGVGANVAITQNFSASLIQILNQNQPIQFNTRYRIDDNWGLGGSSNLNNNHQVFVEYRVNFR